MQLQSGNSNFRQFVRQFRDEYQAAPRQKKPEIALKVVRRWRNLDPPGRFLARTYPNQASSTWHEVGDKLATKRALKNLGERDSKPKSRETITDKGLRQPSISAEEKATSISSSREGATSSNTSTASSDVQPGQNKLDYASFPAESRTLYDSSSGSAQTARNPMAFSAQLSAELLRTASLTPAAQLSSGLFEQSWPPSIQANLQMFNRQQREQLPRNSTVGYPRTSSSNLETEQHPKDMIETATELPTAAALTADVFSECSEGYDVNETGNGN